MERKGLIVIIERSGIGARVSIGQIYYYKFKNYYNYVVSVPRDNLGTLEIFSQCLEINKAKELKGIKI